MRNLCRLGDTRDATKLEFRRRSMPILTKSRRAGSAVDENLSCLVGKRLYARRLFRYRRRPTLQLSSLNLAAPSLACECVAPGAGSASSVSSEDSHTAHPVPVSRHGRRASVLGLFTQAREFFSCCITATPLSESLPILLFRVTQARCDIIHFNCSQVDQPNPATFSPCRRLLFHSQEMERKVRQDLPN